jgi:cytochrome c-type biogenesis protein CcmF
MGEWKPLISFGLLLAFWVIATIFVSIRQRLHNSGQGGLFTKLARQSRSYYSMHLAHFGIAVFIIGVTLVNGYETEKDVRMEIGSTVEMGGYTFRFNGASPVSGPNYQAMRGDIDVLHNGEKILEMQPEKRTYNASGMAMTEPAIDTGFLRDLYVAMGEPLEDGAWVVRVYHKPFVDWIWFGCLLMAFGGILAVTDRRYRLKVHTKHVETATVGAEDKRVASNPRLSTGGKKA